MYKEFEYFSLLLHCFRFFFCWLCIANDKQRDFHLFILSWNRSLFNSCVCTIDSKINGCWFNVYIFFQKNDVILAERTKVRFHVYSIKLFPSKAPWHVSTLSFFFHFLNIFSSSLNINYYILLVERSECIFWK